MKVKLILIGLLIFATSCSSDHENDLDSQIEDEGIVVLQERNNSYPLLLKQKKNVLNNDKSIFSEEYTPLHAYLGRAYNFNQIPLQSDDNFGFPIIDVKKLTENEVDATMHTRLRTVNYDFFAFSNYDRYESKSKVTEKVSIGASVDFKIIKFGTKTSIEKVFVNNTLNEQTGVYGELNIFVEDGKFKLIRNNQINKKIAEKYLSNLFVDELYNNTIKDLLRNYGPLVLTDFSHGGNATAFFAGNSINNETFESREEKMEVNIEVGVSYNGASGEMNFGTGNDNENSVAENHKMSEIKTSIRTVGGGYGFSTFTTPKAIEDTNIDLSGWLGSFEDINKHVITNISDNGLAPLSDYLLEENFRKRILKTYPTYADNIGFNELIEPYLEIVVQKFPTYKIVNCFLITRHSDKIKIYESQKYTDMTISDLTLINDVKNSKKAFYDIKMVMKLVSASGDNSSDSALAEDNVNLEEAEMKKYINPNNNITYLLFNQSGKRYAYAIYDDFILDTYAMRTWVDNLPTISISSNELYLYRIIGL